MIVRGGYESGFEIIHYCVGYSQAVQHNASTRTVSDYTQDAYILILSAENSADFYVHIKAKIYNNGGSGFSGIYCNYGKDGEYLSWRNRFRKRVVVRG